MYLSVVVSYDEYLHCLISFCRSR